MRKKYILTVLVLLLACPAGCNKNILPKRNEIGDLQLVQVIGIDELPGETEGYMITVASKNLELGSGQDGMGGPGGSSAGPPKALVLTSKGKTIFDAVQKLQTHSNKTIFWGHAEYYLIGEEAARDNIAKIIDFFARYHELRIEAKIYIVKGSTAKDLIEQFNQGDYYISDKLESFAQNIKLLSTSEEMKVHHLMRQIDLHHHSARVPCIYLADRSGGKGTQVKDIEICGYAIFSDLKLVGYVEPEISRGVNLILDNVEFSIVVVKDLSGHDVSLEIINSKTEVIPYFTGDNLDSVTLKTKVISNIGEIQSQANFINEEAISFMEAQQSEILKNEMESALRMILKLNSDCLEISDRIQMKRPVKWHKIEAQWMQILPNLNIDIQVESIIQRSYEMREPSGSTGKE